MPAPRRGLRCPPAYTPSATLRARRRSGTSSPQSRAERIFTLESFFIRDRALTVRTSSCKVQPPAPSAPPGLFQGRSRSPVAEGCPLCRPPQSTNSEPVHTPFAHSRCSPDGHSGTGVKLLVVEL